MFYLRLIQNRGEASIENCNNERLKIQNDLIKCVNHYNFRTDSYKIPGYEKTHIYTFNKNAKLIDGIYHEYDNSGYIEDVPLSEYSKYYDKMNELIEMNWVDSNTISVILSVNLYNTNVDLLIITRFLYENMTNGFHFVPDFQLLDFTPVYDACLVGSIICSIICLIFQIRALKLEKPKKMPEEPVVLYQNCCKRLCNSIRSCCLHIKYNYRVPVMFEILSKLKLALILFFFRFYQLFVLLHSYYLQIPIFCIDEWIKNFYTKLLRFPELFCGI
jgi:hypothetical protein